MQPRSNATSQTENHIPSPARQRIAIIGAGASGAIFCAHAVRGLHNTDIFLIERSGVFGSGRAYSLSDPCFLLNVPADKMGGFADNPAHFYEWMQDNPSIWQNLHPDLAQKNYAPDDFVPRMIYGAYLKALLRKAESEASLNNNTIHLVSDNVTGITQAGNTTSSTSHITYESGDILTYDAIIIATGNTQLRNPLKNAPCSLSDIYDPAILAQCARTDGTVIILGTGLGMVDTVHALHGKGYKGHIIALSRRGLLPLPHTDILTPLPPAISATTPRRASQIIKAIRDNIRMAMNDNITWQSVIQSMRSVTQELWESIPATEQKRLQRAMPWWGIARHRIPDYIHAALQDMAERGRLRVIKGSLRNVTAHDTHYDITLPDGETVQASHIFNCTGYDYTASHIEKLCGDMTLATHWSGTIAPITGHKFRISDTQRIYAIGPLLSGTYFESTAVQEIRIQAPLLIQELEKTSTAAK